MLPAAFDGFVCEVVVEWDLPRLPGVFLRGGGWF